MSRYEYDDRYDDLKRMLNEALGSIHSVATARGNKAYVSALQHSMHVKSRGRHLINRIKAAEQEESGEFDYGTEKEYRGATI